MSKVVKFYFMGIINRDLEIVDVNMSAFFERFDRARINGEINNQHIVSGKTMKIFQIIRPNLNAQKSFIIPFGTLKRGATYQEDNGKVEELTSLLYDITFVYYNQDDNVAMVSGSKASPSVKVICKFMNLMLRQDRCNFIMTPVTYDTGLEMVRNARIVRSVSITVNMNSSAIDRFYGFQGSGLFESLKSFTQESASTDAQKISFELKAGRSKNARMNKQQVMVLLNNLNLDVDTIEEIVVHYKQGIDEKIQTAKLRDSYLNLTYDFSNCPDNNLSSSFILDNADVALSARRLSFASFIRSKTADQVPLDFEIDDLIRFR